MKFPTEIMIQKFFSLCFIFCLSIASMVMGQGTAEYKLTFTSTWTSTTHPDNYPGNPHFSSLIGATHNSNVTLWATGSIASNGIESMAETGGTNTLRGEINPLISAGNAGAIISGGGLGAPPTSTSTKFTVTASFPMVSVTSMLAPSPDWFVGVSRLNLLDETNNWRNRVDVELFVYDAGTDSGPNYSSANDNTSPKEAIRRIEESPFLVSGTVKSVGTFVFELQSSMTVDVSSSSVTVVEGDQSTFNVSLGAVPSSTVTVTLSEFSNSELGRSPATLEFSTTDYSTPKTVTITAGQDDDSVDDPSETLTLTANGGGYNSVTQTVTVKITDDDEIAMEVTSTSLSIDEGESDSYDVRLKSQPTGSVTVSITGATQSVTVNPASLTFSMTNWGNTQAVTVTGEQDDDAIDQTVTLSHSASGGGYGSAPTEQVRVSVNDDDVIGIEVSPTSLSINEGANSSYTVRLRSQPSGSVTVSIGGATQSVTVNPTSLTFSTTNWGDTQAVTVTGEQDDDAIDETITLTHSASGGGYGSASTQRVNVTVSDDEQAELVTSATQLSVQEGSSAMYSVRLNSQPSATVSVAVLSNSPDVTVNPSTNLTFTTTSWNQPQTVTVRAGQDDDASNDRVIIGHTASGGNFGSVTENVNVNVVDDDDPELEVLPTSITLLEGTNETYTINLLTEPSGTVTIDVTGGSGVVSIDTDNTTSGNQSSLTFSSSDWSTAQTITISALEDDDESNHDITLTHTASGADYASVEETINISVVDNDEPGLMIIPTSLNVSEGANATYTVQLATQPTGDVTVTVTGASGDVTMDTDANTSGDQGTLTFTTSNWDDAQTVTVTAGEDNDASNDVVTLTNTASGANYDSVESVGVEVTVFDDEIAGASIVGPTTLSIDEGSSATFEVSLGAQPSGDVVVVISAFSTSSLTRDPTSLTFSTSNYDNAQEVTITASHDDNDIDESESIQLTASGGGYDQVASLEITITVVDDDVPEIVLSGSTVEVDEGSSASFDVSLGTIPSADVEVSMSAFTASTLERTPSTLTFTSQNYNQPQTVTVSADQDFNTINEIETLTLTGSGGGYDGTTASVSVTVLDDDVGKPTVNLSVNPNPVSEGESATITVALSEAITGSSVTVPIVFTNDSAESSDYEPVTSIVINANQVSGTIEFVTNEDDDFDNEVLDIRFGDLPDMILPGATTSITLTIQDNDTEMVSVVFSQNIIGTQVDLYVGNSLIVDNFSFQSASSHDLEIGTMKMDVVASDAVDNTSPLYTEEIDFVSDQDYHIVLHGQDTGDISTIEITDSQMDTTIPEDSISVHIVHSAPDLGQIRIEILDPDANNDVIEVVTENLMFSDATSDVLLPQRQFNLAVNGGSNKHDSVIEVFSINWSESSQQKGVLILSGSGQSAGQGLNLMGVWQDGKVYFPDKVTSVEDLPLEDIEFAVGNYPNPFLDQTHLWLNLPEAANVEIQVVDILGRMTYHDIAFNAEAGERHLHEINTSSWPSGVYFYRVVVSTETDQTISTGKMMRVK